MGSIASQITSLVIVYSTVYSDADQSNYQSSASLAFVRGIHRRPVNSPHKWPVTPKMFPFDDVIINIMWLQSIHSLEAVWVVKSYPQGMFQDSKQSENTGHIGQRSQLSNKLSRCISKGQQGPQDFVWRSSNASNGTVITYGGVCVCLVKLRAKSGHKRWRTLLTTSHFHTNWNVNTDAVTRYTIQISFFSIPNLYTFFTKWLFITYFHTSTHIVCQNGGCHDGVHRNGNVVIVMKFSALAALEVVNWQLPVQPATKISSIWLHFRSSGVDIDSQYCISHWLARALGCFISEGQTDIGWYVSIYTLYQWTSNYHKTSSISRTKSQILNVSCVPLPLSSLNPLKPCVKLRMKM